MIQRGVALIAGLALLAALSLLALVATSGMILQRHMAANDHENKRTLENSAIATSFATAWLYSRANHEREDACISDCLLPVAIHSLGEIPAQAEYQDLIWWQSNGIEVGVNPESGESVAENPGTGVVPPLQSQGRPRGKDRDSRSAATAADAGDNMKGTRSRAVPDRGA